MTMDNASDLFKIPLKQITIKEKTLTFGIIRKSERKMQLNTSSINVMSSSGDSEMTSLFLSLVIARMTNLDMGENPSMVIVHPRNFHHLEFIQEMANYYIKSTGDERTKITWKPVITSDDSLNAIQLLDSHDIFFDIYVDGLWEKSSTAHDYMDSLNEKKEGKFILLNRFDRKRLIVTKKCDNEIKVDAKKEQWNYGKLISPELNQRQLGTRYGAYIVEKNDLSSHNIYYLLIYPNSIIIPQLLFH